MLSVSHDGAHSTAILFSVFPWSPRQTWLPFSCYGVKSMAAFLCLTMEHTAWLPRRAAHLTLLSYFLSVCFYVEASVSASVPHTPHVFHFYLKESE